MSDEQLIVLLLLGGGLSILLMISGLMEMIKHRDNNRSDSRSPEKTPLPSIQEQAQIRKQEAMQKKEQRNVKTVKCVFCGVETPESEAFCCSCGRRRD